MAVTVGRRGFPQVYAVLQVAGWARGEGQNHLRKLGNEKMSLVCMKNGKSIGSQGVCVRAFTLVELLVVIAVIAILCGILLPVLSRGEKSATKAECLNNLKQLATASAMYIHDSQGSWLWYDGSKGNWMGALSPYHGNESAVRMCPLATDTNIPGQWGTADKAWKWLPKFSTSRWCGSYCMNGCLYPNKIKTMTEDLMDGVFQKESNVMRPAEIPLFADGNWLDAWPKPDDPPAMNLYEGTRSGAGVWGDSSMGRLTIVRHGSIAPAAAPREFDPNSKLPGAINMDLSMAMWNCRNWTGYGVTVGA